MFGPQSIRVGPKVRLVSVGLVKRLGEIELSAWDIKPTHNWTKPLSCFSFLKQIVKTD